MGLYDTIIFNCPNCEEEIEAQSKSGDCCLGSYSHLEVPVDVSLDANRHAPFECPKCHSFWKFQGTNPTNTVSLIISRA